MTEPIGDLPKELGDMMEGAHQILHEAGNWVNAELAVANVLDAAGETARAEQHRRMILVGMLEICATLMVIATPLDVTFPPNPDQLAEMTATIGQRFLNYFQSSRDHFAAKKN